MSDKKPLVHVIGAGLAGCEAALAAVRQGASVVLHEMKPEKYTPAHHAPSFAELVCSNSLRSDARTNAVGLLKEEMRRLHSVVLEAADATRVPAGSALAVDRVLFSDYVTRAVKSCPDIRVEPGEVKELPRDEITVVATGPLTSDGLASYLSGELGLAGLHFFDAAAPIVDGASLDYDIVYAASRWDRGDADYLNCPMNEAQYRAFYEALLSAKEAPLHDFDSDSQKDLTVFEGCMPVEVMARRGYDTLRFGPMKPVGLRDPRTGREAYAVVQLRKENAEGTMYNLVGFQTHLTFPEQRRVFGLIPGLENAEFLRYGVMHRNTYLSSPGVLSPTYRLLKRNGAPLYFAGQMTGVEGYVESAGSGLVAGTNAGRLAVGLEEYVFPDSTMLGAMAYYVSRGTTGPFQPMNANFGIIAPLDRKVKGGKNARNEAYACRALEQMEKIRAELEPSGEGTHGEPD